VQAARPGPARPILISGVIVVEESKTHYISDRRLYLDADGNVVEAGDPAAATLLVGEGGNLPLARAEELGLVGEKAEKARSARAAKAEAEKAEAEKAGPTAKSVKTDDADKDKTKAKAK
jgi:hypothetical protein